MLSMNVIMENNTNDIQAVNSSEKRIRKHKKRSKRRKVSDPAVTNISHLFSTSLNLVSPENQLSKAEKLLCSLRNDNPALECDSSQNNCCTPIKFTSNMDNGTALHEQQDIFDLSIEESKSEDTIGSIGGTPTDENKGKRQSKNAFEFMMESSKKSIGRNSPGKDMDRSIDIQNDEKKTALLARKFLFERWATLKSNKKRKFEEEDREIYVKQQLEKRARRMKKMLLINGVKRRKKGPSKPILDSEDSQDINNGNKSNEHVTINIDTENTQRKGSESNKNESKSEGNIINVDEVTQDDSKEETEKVHERAIDIGKGNGTKQKRAQGNDLDNFLGLSQSKKSEERKSMKNESDKSISDKKESLYKKNHNSQTNDLQNFLGLSQSKKSGKRKFMENEDDEFISDNNQSLHNKNHKSHRNDLESFLGLPRLRKSGKKESIENESDKAGSLDNENVIKIKMFSPGIFKKKKKDAVSNSKEEDVEEFEPKQTYKGTKHRRQKRNKSSKTETELCTSTTNINHQNIDSKNESETTDIKPCKTPNLSQKNRTKHKKKSLVSVNIEENSDDSVCVIGNDSKECQQQSLRRSSRNRIPSKIVSSTIEYLLDSESDDSNDGRSDKKGNVKTDKVVKLAPIFLQNQKPKIDSNNESEPTDIRQCKRPKLSKQKRTKHKKKSLVSVNVDESSDNSVCVIGDDSNECENQSLRRSSRNRIPSKTRSSTIEYLLDTESDDSIDGRNDKKGNLKTDKVVKLAPIFLQNQKPKIDPLVLEARKQFLMSGIPDALKKIIEKQQCVEECEVNFFPEISHVQQKSNISGGGIDYWNLPKVKLETVESNLKITLPNTESMKTGSLTTISNDAEQQIVHPPEKIKNLKSILLEIKRNNPDYPVFRTCRLLKQKYASLRCEEVEQQEIPRRSVKGRKGKKQKIEKLDENRQNDYDDSMMWTEKYKATTYEDIIGNRNCSLQLKEWLKNWTDISENPKISKRRNSSGSEFDCDSESRDSATCPGNAIIIHGPHGSGKTMTIYALCNELGINVLELNASSKRTGKRLLQELQEATQSHQVRKNENLDLNNFFESTNNKRGKTLPKDTSTNNPKMSLLLVEDFDLVFEQDGGFLEALVQLLSTSKRPIVLVATDISSPSLQKIVSQTPIIKFFPLAPKTMTVWLQIVCLIEGCFAKKESLSELLEWNQGDLRRTLLQLQFWIKGEGGKYTNVPLAVPMDSNTNEDRLQRDNSRLSTDEVRGPESINVAMYSDCISTFLNQSQVNLDRIWWNLHRGKLKLPTHIKEDKSRCNKTEIGKFYKYSEILSFIDNNFLKMDEIRIKQLSVKYANLELKDSIELSEVYTSCNGCKDFSGEWMHTLLSGYKDGFKNKENKLLDMGLPDAEDQRYQRKQGACASKFRSIVPFSYNVDRRSFALDYYPTLRTMSRSEEVRFTHSNKRRKRFVNYLDTLRLHCSESIVDVASKVLNPTSSECENT